MNYTTLYKILAYDPCGQDSNGESGFSKLLKSLGITQADDEPLSLLHILNSNGLDDALLALRASDASEKDMRLYAVWCARQVQLLLKGKRSLDAIDTAERFANGEATIDELVSARDAARDAAWDAALRIADEVTARDMLNSIGGLERVRQYAEPLDIEEIEKHPWVFESKAKGGAE